MAEVADERPAVNRASAGDDLSDLSGNLVFHYTRGPALLGILESMSLWATQVQYLNDRREFLLVYEEAADLVVRLNLPDDDYWARCSSLARLIEHELVRTAMSAERGRMPPIFVVSFSSKWDDLSQWRAYCSDGDGYAIGFNARELARLAQGRGWHFVKCGYGASTRHSDIRDAFLRTFRGRAEGTLPSDEAALDHLTRMLLPIAATVKDEAFEAEDEWRLISPILSTSQVDVKYRAGATTLIPYVHFPLGGATPPAAIGHMTIGPGPNSSSLAIAAAMDACSRVGVGMGFGASQVPYRTL